MNQWSFWCQDPINFSVDENTPVEHICTCEHNISETVVIKGLNKCQESTMINLVPSCEDGFDSGKNKPL